MRIKIGVIGKTLHLSRRLNSLLILATFPSDNLDIQIYGCNIRAFYEPLVIIKEQNNLITYFCISITRDKILIII